MGSSGISMLEETVEGFTEEVTFTPRPKGQVHSQAKVGAGEKGSARGFLLSLRVQYTYVQWPIYVKKICASSFNWSKI